MRNLVLSTALLLSSPALAGGVGFIGHGGVHGERVYFYSAVDPVSGASYADPLNYPQFRTTQIIPQFGGGLELILGDRDDRIQGVFRGVYTMDGAQSNPCSTTCTVDSGGNRVTLDGASVVSAHRSKARHVGLVSMGLNIRLIGESDGFQFGASVHLGSGALTNDHSEYLQFAAGPMVSYRLSRLVFGFADLQYVTRYRRAFQHGVQGVAGVRLMFD